MIPLVLAKGAKDEQMNMEEASKDGSAVLTDSSHDLEPSGPAPSIRSTALIEDKRNWVASDDSIEQEKEGIPCRSSVRDSVGV